MGERVYISRTLQRAYAANGQAPAIADQVIYDAGAPDARPLVGRVLERGLSDEYADRHYLIVEATDGRSHYVEIGAGAAIKPQPTGALVSLTHRPGGIREADRTITPVTASHDGRHPPDP